MTHEYAMSRVRDALEKSEGNHLKAQRVIEGWLKDDQSLLYGLVAPWMKNIVSHAVNHMDQPEKKKSSMPKQIEVDESNMGEFGAALVSGMRKDGAEFGQTEVRAVGKPGKASQSHIDAIHAIAGKPKDKK